MRAHATRARRRATLLVSMAIAGLAWASDPLLAADECGAVAPGGTATCTPAGNDYPSGIFYTTPGITVVVQPGVVIDSSVQDGVGIESIGNLTITTSGAVSVTSKGNNKDGLRADTQNGGNVVVNSTANIVVTKETTSGDGIIARSNFGAVGNGLGTGTVSVTSSGTIEVFSAVGTGISAGGSGLFTTVTVSGNVITHGANQSPALFVANGSLNPLAKAEVNVLGSITSKLETSGAVSPGIAVQTLGSQAIVNGSGTINTVGLSTPER